MKKVATIILVLTMLLSLVSCVNDSAKGSVVRKSSSGDAVLDIMPQKMLEMVDIGEIAVVRIGKFSAEMPFVDERIEEEGKLQLLLDREEWGVSICIYNQDFCQIYDIDLGDRVKISGK